MRREIIVLYGYMEALCGRTGLFGRFLKLARGRFVQVLLLRQGERVLGFVIPQSSGSHLQVLQEVSNLLEECTHR